MRFTILFVFLFPLIVCGQTIAIKTININCDTIINGKDTTIVCALKDIIIADYLKQDTVIDGDTVWVYPYFYKDENYQHLHDSMPDRFYNAYFDDSVTLAFRVHYKNTKPDGIVYYYNKNGTLRASTTYQNGEENGPFTFNNSKGEPTEMGEHTNGVLHGFFYAYSDNGRIQKIEQYEMGTPIGPYKHFYSNGQINTEGCYEKCGGGKDNSYAYFVGTWTSYYRNGQIKEIHHYVESLKKKQKIIIEKCIEYYKIPPQFPIDTAFYFYEEGNIQAEYIYKEYVLVKRIKYYMNGVPSEIINYKDFHKSITDQNSTYFRNEGQGVEYYESGEIKEEGVYIRNKREGEWKIYSEKGELIGTKHYKKGKVL